MKVKGTEHSAVAVVLARAGSKGVPGKNAAMVAGRPCVAWTIDDAKTARTIRHIVVSTDDPSVARVAESMGIQVIDRPAALATDTATVDDAARHAVESLARSQAWTNKPTVPVVILYASVPVRPEGLIDNVVGLLALTGGDSAQTYERVGKFHPWWMVKPTGEKGGIVPWEGEVLNHGVYRRQDLPPALIPDGGAIAVTRRSLFGPLPGVDPGPHAFLGKDRRGAINEMGRVIDIDSPLDLIVADAVLRQRQATAACACG